MSDDFQSDFPQKRKRGRPKGSVAKIIEKVGYKNATAEQVVTGINRVFKRQKLRQVDKKTLYHASFMERINAALHNMSRLATGNFYCPLTELAIISTDTSVEPALRVMCHKTLAEYMYQKLSPKVDNGSDKKPVSFLIVGLDKNED